LTDELLVNYGHWGKTIVELDETTGNYVTRVEFRIPSDPVWVAHKAPTVEESESLR
jgi:hypothetical protein